MSLIEAIIIAIVEGLTEFLPISSTGHMIITSALLGIENNDFTKLFEVSIQLGAILAVVILYRKKFVQGNDWTFYAKLIASVLPALVLGFLFNDLIDEMLESEMVVAVSMLVGGVILLYIDRLFPPPRKGQQPDILATQLTQSELIEADNKLTYKKSFFIGCWQILAMIP